MTQGMWRHRNCLDVDVYIVKVQYRGKKRIIAKALYWNRNYKFFHNIGDPETIIIKNSDLKNWSQVEV